MRAKRTQQFTTISIRKKKAKTRRKEISNALWGENQTIVIHANAISIKLEIDELSEEADGLLYREIANISRQK